MHCVLSVYYSPKIIQKCFGEFQSALKNTYEV